MSRKGKKNHKTQNGLHQTPGQDRAKWQLERVHAYGHEHGAVHPVLHVEVERREAVLEADADFIGCFRQGNHDGLEEIVVDPRTQAIPVETGQADRTARRRWNPGVCPRRRI